MKYILIGFMVISFLLVFLNIPIIQRLIVEVVTQVSLRIDGIALPFDYQYIRYGRRLT